MNPLALLGLLPKLLDVFSGWLNKKQDASISANNNAKDVTVAVVKEEGQRFSDIKDVTLVMMNHPVFWIAWGLGVFPVMLYHAAIFFVSTFPALGWTVHKVPDVELEYAQLVVGSVFTLTGSSTVVAGLAHAWIKRA
ncbi:hypothetical protein [Bradyrhizobium sp. BR 10289]|uniref:hypothetical protein n=1 Tax=Bradyrhizobium sp. BR 10289 TaxID=2749993 RepID=UPI001C64A4D5|nr:hypothetical protein [Bradyrhizobium sp. BR 10289]MBW7970962.1 hypothetical protein [Bradyrhizobium sp. BR 10289]